MKNAIILVLGLTILIAGCQNISKDKKPFSIYIESWDCISFDNPSITDMGYSKMHSKVEADGIIKKYKTKMPLAAKVMLGKNLHINNHGFESEIDEIQNWLVSNGIKDITFRLAMSCRMPPVVRQYKNGKIIKPQRINSASAGPHR